MQSSQIRYFCRPTPVDQSAGRPVVSRATVEPKRTRAAIKNASRRQRCERTGTAPEPTCRRPPLSMMQRAEPLCYLVVGELMRCHEKSTVDWLTTDHLVQSASIQMKRAMYDLQERAAIAGMATDRPLCTVDTFDRRVAERSQVSCRAGGDNRPSAFAWPATMTPQPFSSAKRVSGACLDGSVPYDVA